MFKVFATSRCITHNSLISNHPANRLFLLGLSHACTPEQRAIEFPLFWLYFIFFVINLGIGYCRWSKTKRQQLPTAAKQTQC
jgi:hypothetical protein